jgi:hypothetical protein
MCTSSLWRKLAVAVVSAGAIALGTAGSAAAQSVTLISNKIQPVTITFDELPFQPVDQISYKGVTFDFKVGGINSADAYYNDTHNVPRYPAYSMMGGMLSGTAINSVLTFNFAEKISQLEFGLSLSPVAKFSVELFDSKAKSIAFFPMTTVYSSAPSPQGQGVLSLYYRNPASSWFSYIDGKKNVSQAVINFQESNTNHFVLDNLSFTSEKAPEPITILGSILGIGSIAATRSRKKQEQKAQ